MQSPTTSLIESLETHRITSLTELARAERVFASSTPADAVLLQGPLTAAWTHHVASNRLLLELRGLTPNYPLCAEVVHEARARVQADPASARSWNLAWLVLTRMRDE